MAHNVPAVYDVFAVAIKETVGFQQPQKCAGVRRGSRRRPSRTEAKPPKGAQHIQTCYAKWRRIPLFYFNINPIFIYGLTPAIL
jgi:hypothetical protein